MDFVAERQGFEPWEGLHPQRFSKPSRSTTPAPLRAGVLRRPFRRDFGAGQERGGTSLLLRGFFIAATLRMASLMRTRSKG